MQVKMGEGVLLTGKATRDAEYKEVGAKSTPLCTFSLVVGKRKDTTTIFANCKAWFEMAHYCENISKGDSVCVIGIIEEREYNGKTYTDVVVEWANVVGKGGGATPSNTFTKELKDNDEELPFF